jgi:hypothetical protein
MPDPITIALLAQLASVGLAQKAKKGVQQNRSRAQAMERQRQAGYGREADAAVAEGLKANSMPVREAGQGRIIAALERSMEAPPPSTDLTGPYQAGGGSSTNVKSEIARQINNAIVAGRDTARSGAKLNSFGRANMDANNALAETQSKLGMLGNFSQGSVNALGPELDFANNSMPGTKMASDIAGLIGQGAMLYGLTRPPAGVTTVATPTQDITTAPATLAEDMPYNFNISRRPRWSF